MSEHRTRTAATGGPRIVALPPEAATPRLLARIAELTRSAYRGSDPLPGLPPPDGAAETTAGVRADLARGATVWLAEHAPGEPVGALRVHGQQDGTWRIDRVAVAPAARGTGVARALLRAVEQAAVRGGVPGLRLNAVVERCLPSLYARLGFTPVHHWAADDKPLTEVTMERRPGAPVRPDTLPWLWPEPAPGAGVRWLLTGSALLAVVTDGSDAAVACPPDARLAGVDVWRGGGRYEQQLLLRELGALGQAAGDAVVAFPPVRHAPPVHRMPRAVHPALHALCRLPPGAELPVRQAWPRSRGPAVSAVPVDAVRYT